MRQYNYFLFRLYWVFRDFSKEGHKMSLISTSLASAFFLNLVLYTIIDMIFFFKEATSIDFGIYYKFGVLLVGFIIWILNYYSFIKTRNFLRKDFKKDKKGGLIIIFIILLLGFLYIIGANKNRDKIRKNKKELITMCVSNSLQSLITYSNITKPLV